MGKPRFGFNRPAAKKAIEGQGREKTGEPADAGAKHSHKRSLSPTTFCLAGIPDSIASPIAIA
jgi:hypothetical protein